MLHIKAENNIIYTTSHQKLTEEDYQELIPKVEKMLEQYKTIRWYFEMQDFKGWEMKAFWEDVKFEFRHANDIEKLAVVGDTEWEKWMTTMMRPFTKAEVKYFDLKDKELALEWIKSDVV